VKQTELRRASEKRRAAAERAGSTFTKPPTGLQRHAGVKPGSKKQSAGSGHHEAEFSPLVRLMIRTRAGHGSIENACCEACLIWLGEHGGQIQHIKARGAGGSRDPELGSPAGGALLCGTSETGCHGMCEARDPGMYAAGFWVKFAEVLGAKPVRVGWRTGTWTLRWLLADGSYGDEPGQHAEPELASENFKARDAA
jgi:hypothetical protein